MHSENKIQINTTIKENMNAGNKKLMIICFFGIFISYFFYGLLQENITKSIYGENKDRFTFTMALVFFQCVVNAIFAQGAIKMTATSVDTSPHYLYMLMSFSYVAAMLASNDALKFVSYPTQILGKSIKPIPVMILGVILARKRYPIGKYLFVLMIVLGVAMFMYKPKKMEQSHSSSNDSIIGFGELLLMFSLLMDGITGGIQDKIRSQYRTNAHRMMLIMNLWSLAYLLFGLLATGEIWSFITFCQKYPSVLLQLLIFSLCSAIGQNFIYMTVINFGPLPCSIITTTRKFFTILASVFIFNHPLTTLQWCGTILVFTGLSLDGAYGKEKKNEKKFVVK